MRIYSGFCQIVLIFNICVLVSQLGCSSIGQAPEFSPKKITYDKPINFEIRNRVGAVERTRIESSSLTQTFESGTLRKEEKEIVDFLVESKVTQVKENGDITFEITTLEKDGPTNLQDLAFPEEGETLKVTLDKKSRVLESGTYPKTSMFYIPPISLPKGSVKVGDTWVMKHQWVSLRNALSMQVEVVSILKNIYRCGVEDLCAEIEISGAISILGEIAQELPLKSEIVGRLLVDVDSGSVIWSDIRNFEELTADQTVVKVRSCMETVLSDPVAKRWMWRSAPDCDPLLPLPDSVPGF